MKKILLILFCLAAPKLFALNVTLQAKPGFFLPSDQRLRDIYGGGGIYGAEVAVRFGQFFDIWADGMYFYKTGKSIGQNRHTRIEIIPVGLGLKFSIPLILLEPYVGASAKYFHVNVNNSSPYVKRHQNENGIGWGVKAGFSVLLPKSFLFDIYLEYLRKELDFSRKAQTISRSNVDVGGLIIGGAIGYRF